MHAVLARKLTASDRAGSMVIKGPSELQHRYWTCIVDDLLL